MKIASRLILLALFACLSHPAAAAGAALARTTPPASADTRLTLATLGAARFAPDSAGGAVLDAHSFRARLADTGLEFVVKDSVGAPRSELPFSYRFLGVYAGGLPVVPASGDPFARSQDGLRVTTQHGSVRERYDVRPGGVELSFVLHEPLPLPDGQELELRGRLSTPLRVADPDPGPGAFLRFLHDVETLLVVGSVTVLDAEGARTVGRLRVAGEHLSILVDGEWLEHAAYPVTVDPLIGGEFLIFSGETCEGTPPWAYCSLSNGSCATDADCPEAHGPELAFGASAGRHLVVWESFFSADDHDIWGSLVAADGTVVVAAFPIEVPSTDQRAPTVAWDPGADRWTVCWEDNRLDNNYDIYCEILEASPSGDAVLTVHDAFRAGGTPAAERDADVACALGSCLVVYEHWDGTHAGVKGVRIDSTTGEAESPFGVAEDAGLGEYDPVITFGDPDRNEYLVAWKAQPLISNSSDDIVVDRIGPDGPVGSRVAVASDGFNTCNGTPSGTCHRAYFPDLAYNLYEDRYAIVWQDSVYDTYVGSWGPWNTRFAILLPDGTVEFNGSLLLYSEHPRISGGGREGCFAATYGRRDWAQTEPRVTLLCSDGSTVDGHELSAMFDYPETAIGHDPTNNRYLVVWTSPSGRIRGQQFAPLADLTALSVAFTSWTPVENDDFFAEWTIVNAGGHDAGASLAWMSLSPGCDSAFGDDWNLGNLPVDALAPLTTTTVRWDFTIPDLLDETTYLRWMLLVVDAQANVPELWEGDNNRFCIPINITNCDDLDFDAVCAVRDCDDGNGDVWSTPGEVTDLVFGADGVTLVWQAPVDAGGVLPAYDVLRSSDPQGFDPPSGCVETDDTADTTANDEEAPPGGGVFFYLVRAGNACGEGPLGMATGDIPRSGGACP